MSDDDYSGPERRHTTTADDGTIKAGRRSHDEYCSQHDLLWKHNDGELKNLRSQVCGKIKCVEEELLELRSDIKDLAKSTTPWKVFALSMAIVVGSVGWLATKIDRGQDEIKQSISLVHQRITSNDKDVEVNNRTLVNTMKDLSYSIQSIDERLKKVEKYVEERR